MSDRQALYYVHKQQHKTLMERGEDDLFLISLSTHDKATPIYLLVLRAQEVGNEPLWNKKKVEKCDFFYFFYFFLESDD